MFQFSTRTLFIVMSASAGLAWIFFAPPQWVGLLVLYLLYLMLPAATLAGVIYHRDGWRAFFIGCAPWVVGMTLWFWLAVFGNLPRIDFDFLGNFSNSGDMVVVKLFLAVPIVLTLLSGATAAGMRAWATYLHTQSSASRPPA
jgi:hypothetical protein